MTLVRTIDCPVIDRYGRIDNAFVAFYKVLANTVTKVEGRGINENYVVTNDVEAIAYHANYWYTRQAEADGYPSQQILESGQDVLTVDMSNPDVIAVINSNLEPVECYLSCVEADLRKRSL